jgi:hypothetical protein
MMTTRKKPTDITIPKALVFSFACAACSWSYNTLQASLTHTASAETQKDARDREIDGLTARIAKLEEHAYERGCSHER